MIQTKIIQNVKEYGKSYSHSKHVPLLEQNVNDFLKTLTETNIVSIQYNADFTNCAINYKKS